MKFLKRLLSGAAAAVVSAAAVCSSIGSMRVFAASNEDRIYDFLTGTLRLSIGAACGVLGNIQVETGGTYSPDAYNPNDSLGTQSYGICQWNNGANAGDRLGKLKNYTADWATLEGQLAYMKYELETESYFQYNKLLTFGNTEDDAAAAAYHWAVYYEGCDPDTYEKRMQDAREHFAVRSGSSNLQWTDVNKTYVVTTAGDDLNMRSGPTTAATILTSIPNGSEVLVKKTANNWGAVEWNGKSGYCSMDYLKPKQEDLTPDKPAVKVTAGTTFALTQLSWGKCANADHYEVKVTSSDEKTVIYEKNNVTGESCSVSLMSGSYVATVTAVSKTGKKAASDKSKFSSGTGSVNPSVISILDGHVYALYDAEVWYENAKQICQSFGGSLVTISSEKENNLVYEMVKKGRFNHYWLGGEETATEGTYAWANGEAMSYTNWGETQPDNANNNENRIDMLKTTGKWNDLPAVYNGAGFIIEYDQKQAAAETEYNGSRYQLINSRMNWFEAETYCRMIGGHLAYITSDEENDAVSAMLAKGSMSGYWIGARADSERNFKWTDGTAFKYSNWKEGNPDNESGVENCVEILSSGKWNDARSSQADRGFICEFEPTAPKDGAPQGDVNKDGFLTVADVVMLQKYLLGSSDLTDPSAADLSGDGKITAVDLTLLKQNMLKKK